MLARFSPPNGRNGRNADLQGSRREQPESAGDRALGYRPISAPFQTTATRQIVGRAAGGLVPSLGIPCLGPCPSPPQGRLRGPGVTETARDEAKVPAIVPTAFPYYTPRPRGPASQNVVYPPALC